MSVSGWADLASLVTRGQPHLPTVTRSTGITDIDTAMTNRASTTYDVKGLPAVVGAVRLIASTIDQLDVAVPGYDVPLWLRRPRFYGSPFDQGDLIQWLVTSMAWQGAGYLHATITEGRSWKLQPVHPQSVQVLNTTAGVVSRRYLLSGTPIEHVPDVRDERRPGVGYLLHVPYLITPDHPGGVSPLQQARPSLEGFALTEQYGTKVLDNGTYSGGRLETDQDISATVAAAWQARWIQNRQDGRLPVLGAGLRYVNDLIDPAAAQFIESRAFDQAVVYMMFGIPPSYMGASLVGGQSLSYANAADNNRLFRHNCLEAFTSQIEDALSLLMPAGRGEDEAQLVAFDYTNWEGNDA